MTEADGSIGRKTIVGATWMVAWRFITRALGLVSTFILARILLPSDFGLITMATAVAGIVDALSQVQVQDALVRSHETGRSLYDTAFTMQVARALATALIVAGLAPAAVDWFGEPRLMQVLLFTALATLIGGFENIGIVEFRRSLRFGTQFLLLAVPRLVQVAVAIPLALTLRSYWALLIGTMVLKVLSVGLSYAFHPYRPRITLGRWRSLIGFSFWTWASSIAVVVWSRGDPFILGTTLGAASVGYFLIAGEIAALPISELVAPATSALFAGMAAAQHTGTNPMDKAVPVGCVLLLGVTPLAIGLSATSGYLTAIVLGPAWIDAQRLIAIFAWTCVFSPLTFVATTVLMVTGKVRQNFFAVAIAATVKAVSVYVTSSVTHSLVAVAYSAVACQAVETLAFMVQLRLSGGVRIGASRGALLRIGSAGAVTVVVLSQTSFAWSTVTLDSLQALAVGLPAGLSCVAVFACAQGALWLVAGRPAGPEAELLHLARALVGPRLTAIQRTWRHAG